jgi:hypothetical protein
VKIEFQVLVSISFCEWHWLFPTPTKSCLSYKDSPLPPPTKGHISYQIRFQLHCSRDVPYSPYGEVWHILYKTISYLFSFYIQHGNTNAFQFLVYTSRIGRIITDRSDEDMNSDMTPYGMLLDVLISPKK